MPTPRTLRRFSRLCRLVLSGLLALVASTSFLYDVRAIAAEQDDRSPAGSTTVGAAAVPAYRQADSVAVLTVHEPIDRVTLYSLTRRIERACHDGADAIVLDIDTPGGEMLATLDISNLIKEDAPANTVAWVNPKAYSAGAIIALACREIVVSPNSRIGDAAPIAADPLRGIIPLPAAERAKTESPLLAEVVDSARRNHFDENLVQSFISVGVELWLLENVNTGENILVDRAEYTHVFDEQPPTTLTPVAPPVDDASRQPIRPQLDQTVPTADQSAVFTQEEIQEQIEFAQTLPPVRSRLTAADADDWRVVRQVVSDDRLLTLNQDEAIFYGLAQAVIANDEQLKAFFGAQKLTRYDGVWSEGLVRVLTNPIVMGLIIVVFLLSLFIEMSAPGFGVFGGGALICLALLIGAPYLIGLAQWWDALLIVVGILLVMAELLLIPGTGLAGVGGALCLLIGLVGIFVSGDISTTEGQSEIVTGVLTTLTALFASGVGMWLLSRYVHSIPVLDQLILRSEISDANAPGGTIDAMTRQPPPLQVGDVGVAATDLRPSGRAEFDGRLVEVRSAGTYIARGARTRVVHVGPFAIEVEEVHA